MNGLRARSCSLLAACVLFLAVGAAFSQNPAQFSINESPLAAPTGYVNDYAGVIDAAAKQQLETKIDEFKKSSNPQTELAVAIVRTTGDRDIFDYSLAVARGCGQAVRRCRGRDRHARHLPAARDAGPPQRIGRLRIRHARPRLGRDQPGRHRGPEGAMASQGGTRRGDLRLCLVGAGCRLGRRSHAVRRARRG